MTNKTAATRYARALLDVGVKENASLEQVQRELAEFVELFTQHPSLAVLLNPAVPVQRKTAAVRQLLQHVAMTPMLSKLLLLLAERCRLVLLPDLLASYRERLLDHQNVVRAEVTTATPLDAERATAVERGLAKMTGRTVTLSTKIDP